MHLKFDEYLKDHGIIRSYTYADSVHDRMDRGIIVLGSERPRRFPRLDQVATVETSNH